MFEWPHDTFAGPEWWDGVIILKRHGLIESSSKATACPERPTSGPCRLIVIPEYFRSSIVNLNTYVDVGY
jgi:hypothetical protein